MKINSNFMRLFSAFALSAVLVVTGCYNDSGLKEQMNNQQAELEAALQELRAADAELDGLVSAVAARVTELEAAVEGIETSVGNLGTDVDNLETEVGGITTDVGDIEAGLSELENSINALLERVSQLENRVPDTGNTGEGGSGETGGNYAEQIAAMQKELADLKSAVQSSMDMYSKLESNMMGLQEMLNMHDWDLNDVKQRLESCEAFMAEFNDFKAWVQTELDLIKADIESIKQSLLELIAADADLNGLISALNARVEQLETEIAALKNAESGDNGGTVTPPDNSQVEDLVARVAALEQELAAINTALESLRTKDDELEEAINSLAAIVASNKAEAETTFADLAEFNALKEAVEALEDDYAAEFGLIKSDIDTIKETLTSLEDADETLEGLIAALQERAAEIEKSIKTLEQSVTDDIYALNAKIAELNTELEAVNTATAELKAKDSETDAAIASLRAALEASQQANENAMEAIEADLAEQLAQIEGLSEILQQHIQTATTTFATQEALSGLSAEIEQLKTDYEARFNLIESEIGGIVAMIQSMTSISPYSDGSASANYYTDESNENLNLAIMECNYIVRPAGAAEKLASAWAENKDIMQFRAHYTMTRAAFDFVDVEIKDVAAEGDILTVTGYVDGISNAWINGQVSFSASLLVTDGKTDYCTDFVNVAAADRETDLSAEETANCYMVHERGNYRFKYHSTGTPHSAEVLWESLGTNVVPEIGCLIDPTVELRNNHIYFKTNDTYTEGNAVIAVKDEAGTILWSYHIWMTGDEPGSRAYNNNAGTIMAVNLGALDANEAGLLYQCGRKDPFLGTYIRGSGGPLVASTIEWPEAVVSERTTGTQPYAIKNPLTFITKNSNNGHWLYQTTEIAFDDAWRGDNGSKTKYDPCPPGWKVPAGNRKDAYGNISKNSIWSLAYGYDFIAPSYSTLGVYCSTLFGGERCHPSGDYLFCGYRSEDDGSLMKQRVLGYFWTTTRLSSSGSGGFNCLIVDKEDHSVEHLETSASGARGASVRCIKQ